MTPPHTSTAVSRGGRGEGREGSGNFLYLTCVGREEGERKEEERRENGEGAISYYFCTILDMHSPGRGGRSDTLRGDLFK